MAEQKTRPTAEAVDAVIGRIADPQRRRDCRALVDMMRAATGVEPTMWGMRIIGFGRYHYRYDSGHEGDAAVVGFVSGSKELSLYLMPGFDGAGALLERLGKHHTGKACLYIKRLSDVDLKVLQTLIERSAAAMADQRVE